MMKEWATVISWQRGVALLRYQPHAGCDGCRSHGGCGSQLLNELNVQAAHQLQVAITQPLQPGQRVEVGISEGSLLRSALLVYLTPLLGLFIGSLFFQFLFSDDFFAAIGAVIGGTCGFIVVRLMAAKIADKSAYQPIVLQIGLPPSAIRNQHD